MAFPGHPSPPKTQARPVIANRPQQLGNFTRISPAQRQTAPLRAARLTFAQLARRGAPLTAAVSARVRVAASRLPPAAAGLPRLGDLPRAPRPAGVPTRDPDSPGFLKVSGISPKRSCNLSAGGGEREGCRKVGKRRRRRRKAKARPQPEFFTCTS